MSSTKTRRCRSAYSAANASSVLSRCARSSRVAKPSPARMPLLVTAALLNTPSMRSTLSAWKVVKAILSSATGNCAAAALSAHMWCETFS